MAYLSRAAVVFVLLLAGVAEAQPVPGVETIELGTLGAPGSGATSYASDINNRGEVVGASHLDGTNTDLHAFYWRGDIGMRDLGTLGGTRSVATRINHVGQVIGTSTTGGGETHGFFWTEATGMIDLGLFIPEDLNEFGQVVGNAPTPGGPTHAFLWSEAGGLVDLGTLGGATSEVAVQFNQSTASKRRMISAACEVVGVSVTADGTRRAFYWTAAGGMVDLDTVVGDTGNFAYDIDDAGRIWGLDGTGQFVKATSMFMWTRAGGKQRLLGTAGFGPDVVYFHGAVNDTGTAIGYLGIQSFLRGITWQGGQTFSGIFSATFGIAINDRGQTLGQGDVGTGWSGFGIQSVVGNPVSDRVLVYGVSNAGAVGMSDRAVRTAVFWCQPGQAPILTGVSAQPSTLTPVNHRMVTVRVDYRAWSPCGSTVSSALSVTGDEIIEGDVVVVDANTVQLRAESDDSGDGRVYTIRVRTVDAAGREAVVTVPVSVPRGPGPVPALSLTPSVVSPQTIGTTVAWTASADGTGRPPLEYRFRVRPSAAATWVVARDWSSAPMFSWTPTTAGSYRLSAEVRRTTVGGVDAAAEADYAIAAAVCAPGLVPTITDLQVNPSTLTPSDGRMASVRVDYTAASPCGGPLQRSLSVTSDEPAGDDVVVVDANTVQLRAESDASGDGRVYTIEVRVADGDRVTTRTVAVTVPRAPDVPRPPDAPRAFRADANGEEVILNWESPSGGGAPTAYEVVARFAVGGPIVAVVPTGMATTFTATAPRGKYVLSVRATNAVGAGAESAPVETELPHVPDAPAAPTQLAAVVGNGTVSFAWAAPSTGGPVRRYHLVAGLSPGFATPLATLPLSTSTRLTVPLVPPGTYHVRVVASNVGGVGPASNEVVVVVPPIERPGTPRLDSPMVNGSSVTLTWGPGSGGTPTDYVLAAALTPDGLPVATLRLTGTSYTVPAVPAGMYYLRLVAMNAGGVSTPSPEVTLEVR